MQSFPVHIAESFFYCKGGISIEFNQTKLDKLLRQLRKIEEHRSKAAEKEIRKIYKQILNEIKIFLSDTYSTYAVDDKLTYATLQQYGYYAKFIEEVEQRLNGISPRVSNEIIKVVEKTYEAMHNGMIQAVTLAAGDDKVLHSLLSQVKGTTPEIVKRAVENPIPKLTLKDTLEKNRKEIIYNIKREVNVGLLNGDRYTTVAKRLSKSLDGDYKKAVRIVRTETHRVIEEGHADANQAMDEALKGSGYRMVKVWHTARDERVRPGRGIGKKSKGKYNHVVLEGVKAPMNYYFKSGNVKTLAPSQSGIAGFDINCRCYLTTELVPDKELEEIKIKYADYIAKG
jgi:hypothetical protein